MLSWLTILSFGALDLLSRLVLTSSGHGFRVSICRGSLFLHDIIPGGGLVSRPGFFASYGCRGCCPAVRGPGSIPGGAFLFFDNVSQSFPARIPSTWIGLSRVLWPFRGFRRGGRFVMLAAFPAFCVPWARVQRLTSCCCACYDTLYGRDLLSGRLPCYGRDLSRRGLRSFSGA